jgi:hypothetical protein
MPEKQESVCLGAMKDNSFAATPCSATPNNGQLWNFFSAGNDSYVLQNRLNNLCFDMGKDGSRVGGVPKVSTTTAVHPRAHPAADMQGAARGRHPASLTSAAHHPSLTL